MTHSLRRTATAAIALTVVAPLSVACGAPRAQAGAVVESRDSEFTGGVRVPTPLGTFRIEVGKPVSQLGADDTAALKARRAPDGGTFVPVGLDFQGPSLAPTPVAPSDKIPEVALRTQSGTYPLGVPANYVGDAGGATRLAMPDRYWVAVPDADPQVSIEVTYDGRTWTVSPDGPGSGTSNDSAGPLADLPTTTVAPCRARGWRGSPRISSATCAVQAEAYPWDGRVGWAPTGSSWLVVRVGIDGPILTLPRGDGYDGASEVTSSRSRDAVTGAQLVKVVPSGTAEGASTASVQTDIFRVPASYDGGTLTMTRVYRDRDNAAVVIHQALRISVG